MGHSVLSSIFCFINFIFEAKTGKLPMKTVHSLILFYLESYVKVHNYKAASG